MINIIIPTNIEHLVPSVPDAQSALQTWGANQIRGVQRWVSYRESEPDSPITSDIMQAERLIFIYRRRVAQSPRGAAMSGRELGNLIITWIRQSVNLPITLPISLPSVEPTPGSSAGRLPCVGHGSANCDSELK